MHLQAPHRAVLAVSAATAALATAAATVALALTPTSASGQPGGAVGSRIHTSGRCAHEAQLVTDALRHSSTRADVDGDGRLDTVAVATDQDARRRCRAFVAVDLRRGPAYSTRLHRSAVPPRPMVAELAGLPDLGNDPGAEIVVDTHRQADAMVAQLFTLTADGLERIPLPAFEDGTFVVEGGGVTYPRGAGCTARGRLRLSMASLDGDRYEVTRHTYRFRGDAMRLRGPAMVSRRVPADRLGHRFPEFVAPHWAACTAPVG